MKSSFNQQSSHGIMGEEADQADLDDSVSSSSDVLSAASSESDFMEEVTSSSVASSPPSSSSSASTSSSGPLHDISSLLQQLPLKRGLSMHFQGKSQSFTNLSNVRCLEDLAKPENPYSKKLKCSRSYGGLLDIHRSKPPNTSSRLISKKTSRALSSSLLNVKRSASFLGNRPPIPPHRSTTTQPCLRPHCLLERNGFIPHI